VAWKPRERKKKKIHVAKLMFRCEGCGPLTKTKEGHSDLKEKMEKKKEQGGIMAQASKGPSTFPEKRGPPHHLGRRSKKREH